MWVLPRSGQVPAHVFFPWFGTQLLHLIVLSLSAPLIWTVAQSLFMTVAFLQGAAQLLHEMSSWAGLMLPRIKFRILVLGNNEKSDAVPLLPGAGRGDTCHPG